MASNDYICDSCGEQGQRAKMKTYDAKRFKEAVRKGYRAPVNSALAPVFDALPDARANFEEEFVAKALADNTDWGLCPKCAKRVEGVLKA